MTTVAQLAVRDLFRAWNLDATRLDSPGWNPLGEFIPKGARVVLKPNWVLHENQSGFGLDCLLTDPSVIEAVLEYVALTKPASVVVGDAPLQGCDFEALRRSCDLDGMTTRLGRLGLDVSIADFRRTVLPGQRLGGARIEHRRPEDDYVLFDLGQESLLEPLAPQADLFRVTMYNPDLLSRTHAPGRHQYLIARAIIDADVVINLPKLKSHKKSCITGALKNLVGINGNKEYLPHHRKGSARHGGDCYSGDSWLKRRAEDLLDAANRRGAGYEQAIFARAAGAMVRGAKLLGDDGNVEGSWYGNDTVLRMCLDLQRILHYGRHNGRLQAAPARRVVTITDAIVGGEGEGPLAPTPVKSGFVTGGASAPAVEWVNAILMGFDPTKIPIVRQSFESFPHPIAEFEPARVSPHTIDGRLDHSSLAAYASVEFRPPSGWIGHCELAAR